MKNYLVLDVGGTFIKHALMDEEGTIYKQDKVKTPYTSQEDFIACIEQIRMSYHEPIEGLTLSMPGTIDAQNGFVFQGGSLKYNSMSNVAELLKERLHLRVTLENDAHCAALAELWKGNLQGIQNAIVLTFGTGIGGCFVLAGKPYKGTNLFAGEVSMLMLDDFKQKGFDAVWGARGSSTKLVARICKEKQVAQTDGKTVFRWIEDKDETACAIFKEYCDGIARQLLNLQLIIDPQRICLGGGVSANPIFVDGINCSVKELYESIPIAIPRLQIMATKFQNDSNLLGALYHFKTYYK